MTLLKEKAVCVEIPCRANAEPGTNYRKISWYKVETDSDALTGLVQKDLVKNITTLFKFANQSYEVNEDNSLLLPSATKEDCGVYKCILWPPVGRYIQKGNSDYFQADCIQPELQAVNGKKDALPANHSKIIVSCVMVTCFCVLGLCLVLSRTKTERQNMINFVD
ncbi:hypothetical protein DNTS_021057 [Danionella cerebrum]|uniref:Ig-like domain-containing protein n=1 Tax=Danionella cerebrum TaxID=2873325 RepID=A0A553MWR7_9TELE|nr:hypothetical protein DNTS_021057 [Danionella translucida]